MVSPTVMLVSPSLDFLLFMKHMLETDGFAVVLAKDADSALKPAAIPIINRPPFRFEAGHHSNQ